MSSSSSGVSASSSGGVNRFAGLMSGLDTESLVKAATSNTKSAINSKKQKLQTLTWKQEAYRSVISKLSDFQNKYLDILSSSSIRANAVMKKYKAESSDSKLEVIASANSIAQDYTISSVRKASAATVSGGRATAGSIQLDFSEAEAGDNTVNITLDGTTKEITFQGGDNAKQNFLDAVNEAFGSITTAKFAFKGGREATETSDKLILETQEGDKVYHSFGAKYSDALGLKNDTSSKLKTSATLGSVDFAQELEGKDFAFTINGVDFEFTADTKISDMMAKINSSKAGVKISFDNLTQAFELKSSQMGAGQKVEISQKDGNLINALFNIEDGTGAGQITSGSSVSREFTEKSFNSSYVLSTTQVGDKGYVKGLSMNMEVNGTSYKLDFSNLTAKAETEKGKYNNEEVDLTVLKDSDGNKFFSYTDSDKTVHYLDSSYKEICAKNDSDQKYYDAGGNAVSADEYNTLCKDSGLGDASVQYKKYSASDYADEYTKAFKAAVADSDEVQAAALQDAARELGFDTDGTITDEAISNLSSSDRSKLYDLMEKKASEAAEEKVKAMGITFTAETENGEDVMRINANNNLIKLENGKNFGFKYEENYDEAALKTDSVITSAKELNLVDDSGNTIKISNENGITVNDLLAATDSSGNAIFGYDETTGKISVLGGNKYTYADGDTDTRAFLKDAFGSTTLSGADRSQNLVVEGRNSQITINGILLESASNSFTVNDTTFNIDKVNEFDAADDPDKEITVNVSRDNSSIKETVVNFIKDYNELIKGLYEQVNTSRPKKSGSYYDPLTEEQEDEMSEDEIKKWNEQAKIGLLYNDSAVNKVINQVRTAMSGSCNGMTLSDLGIKLTKSSSTSGEYTIDEDALETAISKYGDEVADFFTDTTNGIAAKLKNSFDAAISTSSRATGTTNTKANGYGYLTSLVGIENTTSAKNNQYYSQMQALQMVIDNLQTRYENQQTMYWNRYANLETYLSKMDAQSSIFSSTTQ